MFLALQVRRASHLVLVVPPSLASCVALTEPNDTSGGIFIGFFLLAARRLSGIGYAWDLVLGRQSLKSVTSIKSVF
jgi:hypothetical protein